MNSRNLAFGGAGLLVAGLFTPIVTLPIIGSVSLFGNGTNLIAIDLVLIAVLAAALAAKDRPRDVLWPGIAASGVLLYEFVSLEYRLSQMKESLGKELQGNPFAGLAQGALNVIQIQWGWVVLAAGAGLMVYAALSAPREYEASPFQLKDSVSRTALAISALMLLFAPSWEAFSRASSAGSGTSAQTSAIDQHASSNGDTAAPQGPSPEAATYIKQNLRLYDLRAKYYDSMLDGRIPGVDFKIQNNGERTVNRVTVRVVFYDASGHAISEEEYSPVAVSQYNIGDNKPLRPHYIWQQESGQFYEAKDVPSEWAEGKVTASITEIEFGPNAAP